MPSSLLKQTSFLALSAGLFLAPMASAQSLSEENATLRADALSSVSLYQALASETFIDTSDMTSDLSGAAEILPEGFAINWEDAEVNAQTGATTYEGLDLSYTTPYGKIGFKFESAAIWGLDEDFLVARINGEQLSETGTLARRIDASGMQVYGVSEAVEAAVEGMVPEDARDEIGPLGLTRFEISTDRLIVDNLKLGAFKYSPFTAEQFEWTEEDVSEILPALQTSQKATAALLSIGYDTAVNLGSTTVVQVVLPGEDTLIDFSAGLSGASDVMGANLGRSVTLDSTLSLITAYSANGYEENIADMIGDFTVDQTDIAEMAVVDNMLLNGLLEMYTTASVPDMSKTDLFTLGHFTNFNGRSELNGDTLVTYGVSSFGIPSATWLIPDKIEFEFEDAVYDISAIGRFAETLLDRGEGQLIEEDPETYVQIVEGLENVMGLLPETGLNELAFDFDFDLLWDADTGAMQLAYEWQAPEYGDERFVFNGKITDYEQLKTLEPTSDPEAFGEALGFMLASSATFNSLTWEQTDKGGYDKLMNMVIGIAKAYPDEEWAGFVSNMTPASMRAMAGLGVRMSKTELPEEVPAEVNTWIDTVADYAQTSGGSLKIEVQPEQPISVMMLGMMSAVDDPSFILDQFGITVTHTPDSTE
ncbi:MAG: hypothetical protein AAGJ85_02725 [Pseudomonadota bacterium]